MHISRDKISASGLTVISSPEDPTNAVVDIILVTGPGGHPVKSWLHTPLPVDTPATSLSRSGSLRQLLRSNSLRRNLQQKITSEPNNHEPPLPGTLPTPRQRRVLRKNKNYPGTSRSLSGFLNNHSEISHRRAASTGRLDRLLQQDTVILDQLQYQTHEQTQTYWPLDLLPQSCPRARIMTWGCQVLSTHGRLLPAQHNIFDHGYALAKELASLRQNTATSGRTLVLIAHSLGGIVVKEMLSRIETSANWTEKAIVQSLAGAIFFAPPLPGHGKYTLRYNVKYQAGLGFNMDPNDKVLEDLCGVNSSLLDEGEHMFSALSSDYNFRVTTYDASIEPSLLDVARFGSATDPNYRSLSSVLDRLVVDEMCRRRELTAKEMNILSRLAPRPGILPESESRADPCPGTGEWFYELPEVRAWYYRSETGLNKLLTISGRTGSGKSTLLKSLYRRTEKKWGSLNSSIICCAVEDNFHNPQQFLTIYGSLLAQLYVQDQRLREALAVLHHDRNAPPGDFELSSFFLDNYVNQKIQALTRRTFIFVDATASYNSDSGHLDDLVHALSCLAENSDFSICIATPDNYYPRLPNTIDVDLHGHNLEDITRYVGLTLAADWASRSGTVIRIADKSAGSFLWAEIVVGILNAALQEGATEDLIEDAVAEMPGDLDGLYEWLFSTLGTDEKLEMLSLVQWMVFSSAVMRLDELCVAVQVSQAWHPLSGSPFTALNIGHHARVESKASQFKDSSNFYSWVRSRSIALIELGPRGNSKNSQRVRFIHRSVRNFFSSERGFCCLTKDMHQGSHAPRCISFFDMSHYCLLRTCLDVLGSVDLPQASLPFARYAADNLLYHLASPRLFRYFCPQISLLQLFTANNCRIWRTWAKLLGCNASDPDAVLLAALGSAKHLLHPAYGTIYRLERIFRAVSKASKLQLSLIPKPEQTRSTPRLVLPRLRIRPPLVSQWSPLSAKSALSAPIFSPLSATPIDTPATVFTPISAIA